MTESTGTDKDQDFNLEDTILAAATRAGNRYPGGRKISGCPAVRRNGRAGRRIEDLDIAADEFVPEEPDAADIEDIMAQISAQQAGRGNVRLRDTRLPDIVFG